MSIIIRTSQPITAERAFHMGQIIKAMNLTNTAGELSSLEYDDNGEQRLVRVQKGFLVTSIEEKYAGKNAGSLMESKWHAAVPGLRLLRRKMITEISPSGELKVRTYAWGLPSEDFIPTPDKDPKISNPEVHKYRIGCMADATFRNITPLLVEGQQTDELWTRMGLRPQPRPKGPKGGEPPLG